MEVILCAEKWVICRMYKQPGTPECELIHVMDNLLNSSLKDYSNVILLGDLNINVSKPNHPLKELFQVTGVQNIVSAPTCFKNPDNPSIIDLVVTNVAKRLSATTCIETGLSDFHMMVCFATKINVTLKPKHVTYRSFKHFSQDRFLADLSAVPSKSVKKESSFFLHSLVPFHVCEIFDHVEDAYGMYESV